MTTISLLMIFTLIVALAIAVALMLHHFRKPENRHPMAGERERNIDEIRREGPEG